ncbi:ABC-three component system middle component 6 [Methylotenera sp.]|uniref:ABC-three component system middle component 6 n=1 Tax=Methylotenera sp. TaxID=2051956 RepID=UPI00345BE3F0
MIVSKNIHPERNLYFTGAIVLKLLENSLNEELDLFSLYHRVNQNAKMTINLLLLTLDWLFLLGSIKFNEGKIIKCF